LHQELAHSDGINQAVVLPTKLPIRIRDCSGDSCQCFDVQGTDAGFKNELLFSQFGINYAQLPEQFKKGSLVIREVLSVVVKHREDGTPVERMKPQEKVLYCDIIGEAFWNEYVHVLQPV
jgi:tRNA(His) 5'-end guanylyltransferase